MSSFFMFFSFLIHVDNNDDDGVDLFELEDSVFMIYWNVVGREGGKNNESVGRYNNFSAKIYNL